MNKKINCREAAYLALLASQREESFISNSLNEWDIKSSPSSEDFRLAQEIAYGACRMGLALNHYAKLLVDKKLNLKRKERALLHTALYQHYYLERIPAYAIANESIAIAKKYCHSTFVKFLNAILRKLAESKIRLPEDDSLQSLSIRYSYPEYFIKELLNDYDVDKAKGILALGNKPGKTFARLRTKNTPYKTVDETNVKLVYIENNDQLKEIIQSSDYYIQNITPAKLMQSLTKSAHTPKSILDLCASPGGKLIYSHDLFPKAKLWANDISQQKIKTLEENLSKYSVKANVSCETGEQFESNQKFDLIIIDAPCTNTGVLNKRPEARWRLSETNTLELQIIQKTLVMKAKQLLAKDGEIWFMTCSILKAENEALIEHLCEEFELHVHESLVILPTERGDDGGFACSLKTSKVL